MLLACKRVIEIFKHSFDSGINFIVIVFVSAFFSQSFLIFILLTVVYLM